MKNDWCMYANLCIHRGQRSKFQGCEAVTKLIFAVRGLYFHNLLFFFLNLIKS